MYRPRPRPALRAALFALVALAALGATLAPVGRAEEPASGGAEVEVVVPEAGLALLDFLRQVGGVTGRTIDADPYDKFVATRKIYGPKTLRAAPDRLFAVARALVFAHEVVLLEVGPGPQPALFAASLRDLVAHMGLRMKAEQVEVTDENVSRLDGQDGWFVATTIPVRNLESLRDARTALQRMVTQSNVGSVQELPEARAFVVTDFAPNVAAIYRQLRAMDVARPRPSARVEYVALKHALAERMVPVLEALFATSAKGANPNRPPETTVPSGPPLRIVADAWTNQVIVSGAAEDIEDVLLVIPRLDKPPAPRPEVPADLVKPVPEPAKPAGR